MKINAAVIREKSGPFLLEEIELDEPRENEVLVRIVGTGLCHTDLGARDGHLPIPPPPSVFGHEGAGVVEKVGKQVTKVKPGDHVVLAGTPVGPASPVGRAMTPIAWISSPSISAAPVLTVRRPCERTIKSSMALFLANPLLPILP